MKLFFRLTTLSAMCLFLAACGPATDAPVDEMDVGSSTPDMGTNPNNGGGENSDTQGDSGTTLGNNGGADSGSEPNNAAGCPNAGEEMCDGACVDTTSDADNCGTCGLSCGASAVCTNSACACDGANDCNNDLGAMGGDGCECAGACDGTQCATSGVCDYEVAGSCSSEDEWCANGACAPCAAGKKNCDLRGTCECEGDCDGTMCTSMACTYDEVGACNSDDSMWCSSIAQNTCVSCTTGFFNCNNTAGCECDSAGCNGQECAGQCFGGECP